MGLLILGHFFRVYEICSNLYEILRTYVIFYGESKSREILPKPDENMGFFLMHISVHYINKKEFFVGTPLYKRLKGGPFG